MSNQVRQLLSLLNSAVDTLDKTCAANGTKIPSLDEPFHPASEAFREDPVAAQSTMLIGAAALQLAAIVLPPQLSLYHVVGGQWHSAALRTCLESSVTEVLREGGPEGVHIDVLAEKTGVDAPRLGRCLRSLTIHNIYREVKPEVFTNTRISSLLDTLKPSQDIIADPEHKHDNTIGAAALVGHHLDEVFKSSAYLWETVSDKTANPSEPSDAPFSKAVSHGKAFFDYLSQPDQAFRQKRFGIGMRFVHDMLSTSTFLQAYDWKSLPKDSLIVDVGGGVGSISLAIAREYPQVKIVVQDQAAVVKNGIQLWEKESPEDLASGRVKFEAHDFFKSQPQNKASVYLLKHIIHDWPDKYAIEILKQLRGAATPNTKLICLEAILPYGCRISDTADLIPGSAPIEAPEPLPAHWGKLGAMSYYLDMTMMVGFNSSERTIGGFRKLFEAAGWKISAVRRPVGKDAVTLAAIEAVPII